MSALRQIGRVLHATDLEEGARAALPYAVYFAALSGTEVHTLHVAEPEGETPDPGSLAGVGEVWERVAGWLGPSAAEENVDPAVPDAPPLHPEVRENDDPARGILAYADEIDAGFLCVGTHARRGLRRLVLGSVAERVVRRSPAPVLTVRRGIEGWGETGLRRILVPVDLSEMTRPALAWSGLLAAAAGARLRAVHVVEGPAGAAATGRRQRIYSMFNEATDPEARPDERLEVELLAGDPASRICGDAEEEGMDLVVAATHGRSGPSRLVLGSVTESVVRRARCPVLTVSRSPPLT